MPFNNSDTALIKTEIKSDPTGLGLLGKGDATVAALLNKITPTIQISRGSIPVSKVVEIIARNPADFNGLSASKQRQLQILLSGETLDPDNVDIKTAFIQIFSGFSNSLSALNSFRQRNGSRTEEILGPGVVLHHLDIAKARL